MYVTTRYPPGGIVPDSPTVTVSPWMVDRPDADLVWITELLLHSILDFFQLTLSFIAELAPDTGQGNGRSRRCHPRNLKPSSGTQSRATVI